MRSILDMLPEEIEPPPSYAPLAYVKVRQEEEWRHPTSEADRLIELEQFLAIDFDTYREVKIAHHSYSGRIDLLAVPKIPELHDVALAFEVKGERFKVQRALKQCADYVGGRVIGGPHRNKRIAACFLYPTADDDSYSGMFILIAYWRVGRGYIHHGGLWLTIGQEVIWDSRGWHEVRAGRMLLGKRILCGSGRQFNHVHVELNGYRRF
jgi:hypothetical protein